MRHSLTNDLSSDPVSISKLRIRGLYVRLESHNCLSKNRRYVPRILETHSLVKSNEINSDFNNHGCDEASLQQSLPRYAHPVEINHLC